MRTIVYIDGFNLYYAVRKIGCKWLNPKRLAELVLSPGHAIAKVKYYTARVSGAADPGQPARQQAYFDALASVPEIEVYQGSFLAKINWRPLLALPIAGRLIDLPTGPITIPAGSFNVKADPSDPRGKNEILNVGAYPRHNSPALARVVPSGSLLAGFHNMEEKGSDVNLATHLVHDAHMKRFDVAAVVSNDSDLIEPIRVVVQELRKPVILLSPPNKYGPGKLKDVASSVRHFRRVHLLAAQFPPTIKLADGTMVSKPQTW
jgi:uncharacterized LabA/DUF88 family protein